MAVGDEVEGIVLVADAPDVIDCREDEPTPVPTTCTGKDETGMVCVAVEAGPDRTHVASPSFPNLHPSEIVAPSNSPNHATSDGPAT
jgi:hypothetical protein